MYAPIPEQAVKIRRCLAGQMRGHAGKTRDSYYRRLFQDIALDLEEEAEILERAAWPPSRPH